MSLKPAFFTAGPAELYPTFEKHLMDAVSGQVGSISHRSAAYKKIHQHTDEQLRELMNIPAECAIMFTGSASEIWERILLNLVELESYHLINGSFSKKFYEYALSVKKYAHKLEKLPGEGFSYDDPEVPEFVELIATTQNETSTGVQMREPDIHRLKRSNSKRLMAVDMVSSAPIPELDFSVVDTAFFSVQKAFGMPAGLGVWIANEACLEKSLKLKGSDKSEMHIGAHHDLPTLWEKSKVFQTPSTPNVLGIYVLGKIAEDMNNTGIGNIRKETDAKAKILYNYLKESVLLSPSVVHEPHRSRTVAVADCVIDSSIIIEKLKAKNLIIGAGYGVKKSKQIRIANFPATSTRQMEILIEALRELEP